MTLHQQLLTLSFSFPLRITIEISLVNILYISNIALT